MLYIVCKQLFRYSVKSLTLKGSQVHVGLNYTPKTDILIKTIGTLPLEYIRLALESSDEVAIFEKPMAKYSFSTRSDSEKAATDPSQKKVKSDVDKNQNKLKLKKIRVLENRLLKPASSSLPFNEI
ncbi:hypothetical protein QE152_g38667 [Popillia japonica]|uniref:Uncharacterized protein n=1 Tax=Popillia japonica TaxID=7064 RepID=A0AAW1HWB5_POPJA